MPNGKTLIHIDTPTYYPNTILFEISGWIASDIVFHDGVSIGGFNLTLTQRKDVEQAHPTKSCVYGFRGTISEYQIKNNEVTFNIIFESGVKEIFKEINFTHKPQLELSKLEKLEKYSVLFPNDDPHSSIQESFKLIIDNDAIDKLEQIKSILRCPICGSGITIAEKKSVCENHHEIAFDGKCFNFLDDALISENEIINNMDVASRSQDPLALALIGKFNDGLILDCGAGLPKQNFRNVVNYEIEKFANTDVIGIGEYLPFNDNSFDVIFSFSVLEHIKDPFKAANELNRVLKPNGILYVNTPFLIPVHGYPHHYYNMTIQGLKNLFPTLNVVTEGVPSSGHPFYAVQSILGIWASNLDENSSNELLSLTVNEILNNQDSIIASDACQKLEQEAQKIISCTNSLLAVKP